MDMYRVTNITHDAKTTTFDLYKKVNRYWIHQGTDTIYCIRKTEEAILKTLGYQEFIVSINNQALVLAKKFDIAIDGQELINTLKNTAFKTKEQISDAQMMALLIMANQHNLNPWTKEIYAFPDKGGIVPIVGVDGWSRIINSHPQFDGMDFEQGEEKCTCIIYRKDRSHPVRVTEYHDECYRPPFTGNSNGKPYTVNGPWQSHPKRMLRHKAMIQCARLAFSFTGIYDEDEAKNILNAEKPTITQSQESAIDVSASIKALEIAAKSGKENFCYSLAITQSRREKCYWRRRI